MRPATAAFGGGRTSPPVPPGSAFPPAYILRLRSCLQIDGCCITAPLPPVLPEELRTTESLRSTGITPLRRYCGPIRHPLVVGRFPGVADYTAYPASAAFAAETRKGFSSCSLCPCRRAVANHPAGVTRRVNRPATGTGQAVFPASGLSDQAIPRTLTRSSAASHRAEPTPVPHVQVLIGEQGRTPSIDSVLATQPPTQPSPQVVVHGTVRGTASPTRGGSNSPSRSAAGSSRATWSSTGSNTHRRPGHRGMISRLTRATRFADGRVPR